MIEKIAYAGYPNNFRISNGRLEAIVTADYGPRIIRFGFTGERNEFAELPQESIATDFGNWHIYGGHRLWHSPEAKPRSYYPDDRPVNVEIGDDYIEVTQPVEPPTGIIKAMRLSIGEDYLDVEHSLANEGQWPVELSPWALSVMAPGGFAILPQAQEKDPANLLPNRVLMLWPYTDLNDSRLKLGKNLIRLYQDTQATVPIKIGLNDDSGWAAYYNQGHLFLKRFSVDLLAAYPDNGCTVESYTNASMLELESLGPLVLLESGEATYHTERWYLFDNLPLDEKVEQVLSEKVSVYVDTTSEPD